MDDELEETAVIIIIAEGGIMLPPLTGGVTHGE